ncbi:hypothetical protein J4434_08180 [Candidatus Woesearchaeota archaeon]|nr:hypothetical protein [Candidatus Woesearchaeota archaeon]
MNWTKLFYVLMIVLIFIPMVFLGANVFYPEYTGTQSYYQGPYADCYQKYPYPTKPTTAADTVVISEADNAAISQKQEQCQKENQEKQLVWEQEKLNYEGTKYIFITLFNLVILLIALLIPVLQDSVTMGLFLGSIATTFGATIRYFDTRSKIGFIILVITFFAMLYFINRKKDSFVNWKDEKQ